MIEVEVRALVADVDKLKNLIESHYPEAIKIERKQLNHFFNTGKERTRWDSLDGVSYVVKDNANGLVRGESETSHYDLSQDELNHILLTSYSYTLQAKWSRLRTDYKIGNFTISVNLNSGYRGVCEVETLLESKEESESALEDCRAILAQLGLEELDSELLEQMFSFYNQNWQDFYATSHSIFDDPRFQRILGK